MAGNANFASSAIRAKKMIRVQNETFAVHANTFGLSACSAAACPAAGACSCIRLNKLICTPRRATATTRTRFEFLDLVLVLVLLDEERDNEREQRRAFDQRRQNDRG